MRDKLLELGFTKNEAIVYSALCRFSSLTGYDLAKKTGLDRSVTYNLLRNLIRKGVVGSVAKSGKKEFFVSDPNNLLREIEAKQKLANELIEEVSNIRPIDPDTTKVETFEGIVASRKFYALLSKIKRDVVYTYGGSGIMLKRVEIYIDYYRTMIKKNKFKLRWIIPKKYANTDLVKKVPCSEIAKTNQKVINASFNLCDDNVIFHIYEESPRLIWIKDKLVADLMRGLMDDYWSRLKKE